MKTQISHQVRAILFIAMVLSGSISKAQDSFMITAENLKQTAANKLEFDVYLLDTDVGPFELGSCQLGFTYNTALCSGGTISAAIDNSNSGLNSLQRFTTAPNTASTGVIKLLGAVPPGAGNGTIISQDRQGTLLTHFTITSTVNFAFNSTSDLSFYSSGNGNTFYPTRVSQYVSLVNTPLTVISGVNAIVNGNPNMVSPAATAINPATITSNETAQIAAKGQIEPEAIKQIMVNCYPNPFSNKTTIKFALAENSPVKLVVFDLAGNLVKTLFDDEAVKDTRYEVEFDGKMLSPGIYFYKLSSAKDIFTGKILLLKD